MKLNIVYWSGTGNTETMANFIQQGAQGAGAEVEMFTVDSVTPDLALDCDILVLGCPAMGSENLEDSEFEPFMESLEPQISGKKIALFGSYDWGECGWMRTWEERVRSNGGVLLCEGLTVNLTPDSSDEERCAEYGKSIVS